MNFVSSVFKKYIQGDKNRNAPEATRSNTGNNQNGSVSEDNGSELNISSESNSTVHSSFSTQNVPLNIPSQFVSLSQILDGSETSTVNSSHIPEYDSNTLSAGNQSEGRKEERAVADMMADSMESIKLNQDFTSNQSLKNQISESDDDTIFQDVNDTLVLDSPSNEIIEETELNQESSNTIENTVNLTENSLLENVSAIETMSDNQISTTVAILHSKGVENIYDKSLGDPKPSTATKEIEELVVNISNNKETEVIAEDKETKENNMFEIKPLIYLNESELEITKNCIKTFNNLAMSQKEGLLDIQGITLNSDETLNENIQTKPQTMSLDLKTDAILFQQNLVDSKVNQSMKKETASILDLKQNQNLPETSIQESKGNEENISLNIDEYQKIESPDSETNTYLDQKKTDMSLIKKVRFDINTKSAVNGSVCDEKSTSSQFQENQQTVGGDLNLSKCEESDNKKLITLKNEDDLNSKENIVNQHATSSKQNILAKSYSEPVSSIQKELFISDVETSMEQEENNKISDWEAILQTFTDDDIDDFVKEEQRLLLEENSLLDDNSEDRNDETTLHNEKGHTDMVVEKKTEPATFQKASSNKEIKYKNIVDNSLKVIQENTQNSVEEESSREKKLSVENENMKKLSSKITFIMDNSEELKTMLAQNVDTVDITTNHSTNKDINKTAAIQCDILLNIENTDEAVELKLQECLDKHNVIVQNIGDITTVQVPQQIPHNSHNNFLEQKLITDNLLRTNDTDISTKNIQENDILDQTETEKNTDKKNSLEINVDSEDLNKTKENVSANENSIEQTYTVESEEIIKPLVRERQKTSDIGTLEVSQQEADTSQNNPLEQESITGNINQTTKKNILDQLQTENGVEKDINAKKGSEIITASEHLNKTNVNVETCKGQSFSSTDATKGHIDEKKFIIKSEFLVKERDNVENKELDLDKGKYDQENDAVQETSDIGPLQVSQQEADISQNNSPEQNLITGNINQTTKKIILDQLQTENGVEKVINAKKESEIITDSGHLNKTNVNVETCKGQSFSSTDPTKGDNDEKKSITEFEEITKLFVKNENKVLALSLDLDNSKCNQENDAVQETSDIGTLQGSQQEADISQNNSPEQELITGNINQTTNKFILDQLQTENGVERISDVKKGSEIITDSEHLNKTNVNVETCERQLFSLTDPIKVNNDEKKFIIESKLLVKERDNVENKELQLPLDLDKGRSDQENDAVQETSDIGTTQVTEPFHLKPFEPELFTDNIKQNTERNIYNLDQLPTENDLEENIHTKIEIITNSENYDGKSLSSTDPMKIDNNEQKSLDRERNNVEQTELEQHLDVDITKDYHEFDVVQKTNDIETVQIPLKELDTNNHVNITVYNVLKSVKDDNNQDDIHKNMQQEVLKREEQEVGQSSISSELKNTLDLSSVADKENQELPKFSANRITFMGSSLLERDFEELQLEKVQAILKQNVEDLLIERDSSDLNVVVHKYKQLAKAYEELIKKQSVDLDKLTEECLSSNRLFTSTEMAFSDLYVKYQKARASIEAFKENEDRLLFNIESAEDQLVKLDAKYDLMTTGITQQISEAQQQVEAEKQARSVEIAKLLSTVKRMQIKASSLENSLRQKTEECQALSTFWDDMTGQISRQ